MSLEEALVANTTAVNELIGLLKTNGVALPGKDAAGANAKASEPQAEKPRGRPKKDDTPKVTFEDMKAALFKVRDEKGAPAAQAIIKDVGKAPAMKEVKPENFAAVIAACEAALVPSDDGDDGLGGDDDGL